MEKKKVLFVFQEITPYLPETEKSIIGRYLPQGIQERGKEIRTFMPRYGCVNERRNQLHEVIRLSGMNLVINDTDHPLIIKVASIQAARMQVYFIDNEDYFHRKFVITDKNEEPFDDNDERAIFFARGVLETVIKLRWAPDLIHCNGWFGAIVPILIKKTFANDPLFINSKVILSVYDDEFNTPLDVNIAKKVLNEEIRKDDVKVLENPTYASLYKLGIQYADGIVMGSPKVSSEVGKIISECGKPVLEYTDQETYIDAYNDFYDKILNN
ncbi:MAG: glycogen/starch synthase [Prolixibacteraceae bacterium]|nr:glycogen/starch synthase [Prolixibacteraceae bacterium]